MIKKIFSGLFKNTRKERSEKREQAIEKLSNALNVNKDKDIKVLYEELNQYKIKGHTYKLGDKVICRSNECDPLLIGTLVEFWDNDGKWSTCIPQVKDEDGKVWGHMGIIKPYSDELFGVLQPMRPLEQWNYLLDDNVKEMYSFTEEEMDRKEKAYEKIQKLKSKNSMAV